jgi:hypothetical protein
MLSHVDPCLLLQAFELQRNTVGTHAFPTASALVPCYTCKSHHVVKDSCSFFIFTVTAYCMGSKPSRMVVIKILFHLLLEGSELEPTIPSCFPVWLLNAYSPRRCTRARIVLQSQQSLVLSDFNILPAWWVYNDTTEVHLASP